MMSSLRGECQLEFDLMITAMYGSCGLYRDVTREYTETAHFLLQPWQEGLPGIVIATCYYCYIGGTANTERSRTWHARASLISFWIDVTLPIFP